MCVEKAPPARPIEPANETLKRSRSGQVDTELSQAKKCRRLRSAPPLDEQLAGDMDPCKSSTVVSRSVMTERYREYKCEYQRKYRAIPENKEWLRERQHEYQRKYLQKKREATERAKEQLQSRNMQVAKLPRRPDT